MTYILKHNSLTKTRLKIESQFSGSSKFKLIDGELVTKKNDSRKFDLIERKPSFNVNQIHTSHSAEISNPELLKKQEKKQLSLNKSKVRSKINALCRLEKSKRFLAFYSISFPLGLKDEKAYQVFNTWLSRCRNKELLQTYIWVAERQKNGTIHFHLLTNDFMNVRIINSFMAAALKTQKKYGIEALVNFDSTSYNGVDVKKVGKNKRGINSYLTKYITKNNIKFYKQPWHCSRDISRLFTSQNFDKSNIKRLVKYLPKEIDKYTKAFGDKKNYIGRGFKFEPNGELFFDLDTINEIIYNEFHFGKKSKCMKNIN